MNAIPIYYLADLLADSASFSPSASKPQFVVEAWQHAGLPIVVRPVTHATVEDFCLAHDPEYVKGILACIINNGFGNQRADVAKSLPFTTGAMMDAATAALDCGIACAPVSGFHHAGYANAQGFCTFNGLMVTALKLLHTMKVRRVLILDLDQHFGNGTDGIKSHLGIGKEIINCTFGRWYDNPSQADQYLDRLQVAVNEFPKFDLILYQAGADLHVDDPLGGVLDSDQMRQRDRMVFEGAKKAGVPLAWNLAGGYQDPISKVLRIHQTTMEECARVFVDTKTVQVERLTMETVRTPLTRLSTPKGSWEVIETKAVAEPVEIEVGKPTRGYR